MLASAAALARGGDQFLYVGTYTTGKSPGKGIHLWRFRGASGQIDALGVAAETPSPSFLAVHPNGRFLYAANEVGTFGGEKSGSVTAFEIDRRDGKLRQLNAVSSKGSGPCYVTVDATGRNVLVANYGAGSVAVLPVEPNGRLREATAHVQHTGSSVNPKRQGEPHAHCVKLSPDNRFALVADLGLDKVLVYRFDPKAGTIAPNDPPFAKLDGGAGPRHFAFQPNGRVLYVINELNSTVTRFSWDAKTGRAEQKDSVSTLPSGHSGENYPAEIVVHPNGKWLFGSNRGHNSIVIFVIDGEEGKLTPVDHVSVGGDWPRNFTLSPDGVFLFAANQRSDNVVVFRFNGSSGRLAATGDVLKVGSPACVRFAAAG